MTLCRQENIIIDTAPAVRGRSVGSSIIAQRPPSPRFVSIVIIIVTIFSRHTFYSVIYNILHVSRVIINKSVHGDAQ